MGTKKATQATRVTTEDEAIEFFLCYRDQELEIHRGPTYRNVILRLLTPKQNDNSVTVCHVVLGFGRQRVKVQCRIDVVALPTAYGEEAPIVLTCILQGSGDKVMQFNLYGTCSLLSRKGKVQVRVVF